MMKKYSGLILAFCALILGACSTVKYVPIENVKYVTVRDSVAVHDTLVDYKIEKEYVKEYSKDTLRIETMYSKFEAYQDTLSGLLAGSARNKDEVIPIKVQWRDKIIARDSIVFVEVPVEVPVPEKYVPGIYKWGLRTSIALLLLLAALILLKFKNII